MALKIYQKALVTGASSGIGRSLARSLAPRGDYLLLTGRDAKSLETLGQELQSGVQVELLALDLRDKKSLDALLKRIEEQKIDLVVNNAGLGFWGPLESMSDDELEAMIEVNIEALVLITKKAVALFKEQKRPATIVNVSSISAIAPMPLQAVYGASKAFVQSFSKAVDFECRNSQVRVLTVAFGPVHTPFSSKASRRSSSNSRPGEIQASEAAAAIVRAIERKKGFTLVGLKMKLASLASHLLCEKQLLSIIERTIEKRL